jgi:ketosteroid isomerase-like protein
MPEELRGRLTDAASSAGRSINREIVNRLEESFVAQSPARTARVEGEKIMGRFTSRRTLVVVAAIAVALAAVVGGLLATSRDSSGSTRAKIAQKQIQFESQGAEKGAGAESNDYLTLQQQFAEARTAPSGIVDPGAYSSALGQLNGLPSIAGTWTDVTAVKYDADNPAYRDYFSNSSGGSGLVTGRITGLAADAAGDIWAAGADGGVWRHLASAPSPYWKAIDDGLLSLSSGDLEYYGGKLYYDPGVPAARRFCVAAILDAVRRYDLDGVHFDDYFYPYPVPGQTFADDATLTVQTDHVTFTGADEIRRMFNDFFGASASIRHEIRNIVVEEAAGKVATEQGYIGELKDGSKNDMHNCNFFDFDADGKFKRVIIWMAGTNPLK